MIPFRQWFAYAVTTLGVSPEDFWGLTLAEWRFLAPDAPAALSRAGLAALIAQYRDGKP